MGDQRKKKKHYYEIKTAIIERLELYPHNTSQLAKAINTNQQTVKRHLEELEDLHAVRHIKTTIRGKEKQVWELVD